jgi:antitoxin ParD1/3/4
MNLSLTPEVEQFIQIQLESGKYATAEEVVLAGIKLLEEREKIYKERLEELKREIMIGIEASERGEVIDGEEFFQKMQLHLQQRSDSSR